MLFGNVFVCDADIELNRLYIDYAKLMDNPSVDECIADYEALQDRDEYLENGPILIRAHVSKLRNRRPLPFTNNFKPFIKYWLTVRSDELRARNERRKKRREQKRRRQ